MAIHPFQMKNMLRTYGEQLTNARRLARFRRSLMADGTEDEVSISREAKRKSLVERISREIVDNLIAADTDNPVVQEIKSQIEDEFGSRLVFRYGVNEQVMQVFKESDSSASAVAPEERERIMARLWQVTLARVDDTML